MRSPFALPQIIVFVGLLLLLQILVQIGALSIAFDKLGLSRESALLLLAVSLFGSALNLPLFSLTAQASVPEPQLPPMLRGLLRRNQQAFTGKTLIAVNVGGGVVPAAFSLYLFLHNPLPLWEVVVAVLLVSTICYQVSRPIPGLGIGMPVFVAPLAAASVALLMDPQHSAPLAYICGTLGVLIGADLLRLGDILKMGTPVAAIGGAGTFDGIFITGLVAVLLA